MKHIDKRILSLVTLISVFLFPSSCISKQEQITSPSRLTIEEYPLQYAPIADPLSFIPKQGSPDEILAKHQQERDVPSPDNSILYNGQPAFSIQLGDEKIIAFESYESSVTSQGTPQTVTVQVLKNDMVIYNADAGDVSPISNLRGLWTYSDHWVIEIAYVKLDPASNDSPLEPVGQIIQDGESLNDRYGYEQAFGFQLINDKPFFFFQQNGKTGISYDGEQFLMDFDQIPHYQCCSDAVLNPRTGLNMVSFFAQRQGTWYYVEAGVFK